MSERCRRATGWLGNHSLHVAMVLIALLSTLSGCGSGQTDTGQTGNSVPVSLSISMPQNSAASASTVGSRFWATLQSWLPSLTSAWAQTQDGPLPTPLRAIRVDVTGPGLAPISEPKDITPGTLSGSTFTIDLEVPVGSDRVFTVSGFVGTGDLRFQGKSTPKTLVAGKAATVDITLVEIPAITTPSLPNGTVGVTYLTSSEDFVTLSVSGGTPPYTWSVVENLPPAPGLSLSPSGATAGQITGVPTTTGTFTGTYRVQDSIGAAGTKDLKLTVNRNSPPNSPPIANAGLDQNFSAVGNTVLVTLDGRASSDPDGDTLTYLWEFTQTSAGCPVPTLSDTTSATPSFRTSDSCGGANTSYTLRLIVNDGKVDSKPATVTITFVNG